MAAILGALKGASRALILLLVVGAIPGLALLVAVTAEGVFGLGFKTIFFGMLALEILLGIGALFGIATEIEASHSRSLGESAAESAAPSPEPRG
ncbi:MAG: hypothetical protein OEM05_04280 [Myxococcales bacterium]|nr:hypothetical protein [Myxococcales bacterium]